MNLQKQSGINSAQNNYGLKNSEKAFWRELLN